MAGRVILMMAGLGWPVPGLAQNAALVAGAAPDACVQVTIAGQTGSRFNCINQALAALAHAANGAAPNIPGAIAAGPDATGTFSETGLAEQYGQNFGRSALPYRPPPPVFSGAVH